MKSVITQAGIGDRLTGILGPYFGLILKVRLYSTLIAEAYGTHMEYGKEALLLLLLRHTLHILRIIQRRTSTLLMHRIQLRQYSFRIVLQ